MVMFMMAMAMALLGFAVCAALMSAADHHPAPAPRPRVQPAAPQFFVAPAAPEPQPAVAPVEVLVADLERHIRLEQAAAESFVHAPTPASLHGRTASPLLH